MPLATPDTPLPLQGVRVYDATQGVAGPTCTLLMAFCGAEVIKVEPPGGDWLRHLGQRMGDHSPHSWYLNRAKRSVVLDMRQEADRLRARRLAHACDVVIEAFRPGVMARLGLGESTLRAHRPDLIHVSLSGYGQDGPMAQRPAVDGVLQAWGGWMQLNRDDREQPRALPYYAIDMLTGLYAFQAVQSALIRRWRFGVGDSLDISLMHSAAAFLAPRLLEQLKAGGQGRALFSSPNGAFRTCDGWFAVAVTTQAQFVDVCTALDLPALAQDARFASRELRVTNREVLDELIAQRFATLTVAHCDARFEQVGAMGAPVQDAAQVNALLQPDHPLGLQRLAADAAGLPTWTVPGLPTVRQSALAPALGADGEAVWRGLD